MRQLSSSDPRQARAREIIERQVNQQAHLLEDLLDVSRIVRGKITLRPERLDLVRLVRDTAEDCRSVLEAAGLALSLELPEVSLWVSGDPTRLSQVVTNVLQNSAKFTDRGGRVMVRLTEDSEGQHANLTIQDTGIGIEPEMLPRIFETFAQADHGLDRSRGGLGLGLALVKGLVELHHGEVRAHSDGLGHGAEFTIRLPVAPSPVSAGAGPISTVTPTGPIRVLIAEDNPDAAETLRDLLELSGCTVATAASGPEALEVGSQFQPEVVLCDLGLPGLDGYQVAAELRRHPVTAKARLIAISGYGQDEDVRRSREAGFDMHLTKPVDFDELQRFLEVSPERDPERRKV